MTNNVPKLYRRRFIPDENIHLKDDKIVYMNDNMIITKWDVLKPRKDIAKGISCYCMNENFKISKILNSENELVYYYCDIIETIYDKENNIYTFNDLLADVIVYENGQSKILDLEEIADALEEKIITIGQTQMALRALNNLLQIIYNDKFGKYIDILNSY